MNEIEQLLAQPEQEPKFNFDLERMKAAIESPISDVTVDDLVKQVKQEPVAWITEWVQRYRHNDTPIMDRAVSFTKGDAPAVPNPNYIPLYTAPPKREPLINIYVLNAFKADDEATHPYSYWAGVEFAEKHHGIGGGE